MRVHASLGSSSKLERPWNLLIALRLRKTYRPLSIFSPPSRGKSISGSTPPQNAPDAGVPGGAVQHDDRWRRIRFPRVAPWSAQSVHLEHL